jgi:hypothetical protein
LLSQDFQPSKFFYAKNTAKNTLKVSHSFFPSQKPLKTRTNTLESLESLTPNLKKSTNDYKAFLSYFRANHLNSNLQQHKKLSKKALDKSANLNFTLFDVNFLKKERLYTKLKYSRSPAYDIVSGGSAALLAGFIGFLISEKFGIELVDSGDFYIVFMYAVFASFSLRPLLKILSKDNTTWDILSLNFLVDYLYLIFTLFTRWVLKLPLISFLSTLKLKREYVSVYFLIVIVAFLL